MCLKNMFLYLLIIMGCGFSRTILDYLFVFRQSSFKNLYIIGYSYYRFLIDGQCKEVKILQYSLTYKKKNIRLMYKII